MEHLHLRIFLQGEVYSRQHWEIINEIFDQLYIIAINCFKSTAAESIWREEGTERARRGGIGGSALAMELNTPDLKPEGLLRMTVISA